MNYIVSGPLTRGTPFTFNQLVDAYMATYAGRDQSLATRLHFFVECLGEKLAHEIDGDDVADALDQLVLNCNAK